MSTATQQAKPTQLIEVENDLLQQVLDATKSRKPEFSIADVEMMAQRTAKSRFYKMDENQIFVLMQIAQAEGCHPITATQRYDVIFGKPAKKAVAMLADFQKIGGSVTWLTEVDDSLKCEAIFKHPTLCPDSKVIRFSFEQAKKAGYTTRENPDGSPNNWLKRPEAMLRARVITSAIRMLAPNITAGLMTPDEIRDDPNPEEIDLAETAWDRLNQQDVAETTARHANGREDLRAVAAPVASQATPEGNGRKDEAPSHALTEDEAMDRVAERSNRGDIAPGATGTTAAEIVDRPIPREPGADDEAPKRRAKVRDGKWLAQAAETKDLTQWFLDFGQTHGYPSDITLWSKVMVGNAIDARKAVAS